MDGKADDEDNDAPAVMLPIIGMMVMLAVMVMMMMMVTRQIKILYKEEESEG